MKKTRCPYKRIDYVGNEDISMEICSFKSNKEFEEFDDSYCFFKKETECLVYKLLKEKQELKDKVQNLQADYGTQAQIERDMLRQENQELKKQQKEFIKYLEDEIAKCEENIKETKKWLDIEEIHSNVKNDLHLAKVVKRNYEETLSKYKKIIGSNTDVTR